MDQSFVSPQFPRASKYDPVWIRAGVSGGANALWLTDWLTQSLELRAGMRVLDLGCGLGSSSVFLRREFGVQVWAVDLWNNIADRARRLHEAGVDDRVFPIHADGRALPFAPEFFDTIVSIDSFPYYGTDEMYLAYLAPFVKPGGAIGIAGAGVMQEVTADIPDHLREWWLKDQAWALHSASWWRHHWEKTGLVKVDVADTMPDGWQRWLDWHRAICPDNQLEIQTLEKDQGRYLGYVRVIGRRI